MIVSMEHGITVQLKDEGKQCLAYYPTPLVELSDHCTLHLCSQEASFFSVDCLRLIKLELRKRFWHACA